MKIYIFDELIIILGMVTMKSENIVLITGRSIHQHPPKCSVGWDLCDAN